VEIDIDDNKQIFKLGCFKTLKVAHQSNCLMDNQYLVELLQLIQLPLQAL
jgi:hypothetical protein